MIIETLFVALIIFAVFLQAANKPRKGLVSPLLPIFLGIITLLSSLLAGNPKYLGISFGIGFLLLGFSDYFFDLGKDNLFPVAIGLGLISGLLIGVVLHIYAFNLGVNLFYYFIGSAIAIGAGFLVLFFADPPKEFKIPVYLYIVQIVILLAGGIAAGFVGNYYFLLWGILLFISDSLVGIRSFPNEKRKVPGLTVNRILMLILLVYYTAMFVMIKWAVEFF
jgi:hypothetical protein